MTMADFRTLNIVRDRLRNQRLSGAPTGTTAPDVVCWLGAVQAQDCAAEVDIQVVPAGRARAASR